MNDQPPIIMASNKISKNVLVMGLVSFFNDLSSEMIYPLVPIFLVTILGAPVSIVGLIEGIAESASSIFKVIFGWISDKTLNRKRFVVVGYLLSTFSKILLALSYSWPLVLVARFSDRFGKGVRTAARDALIAESSTIINRGISFGFHRALDTLGAVLGPLLAIMFITSFHNNFHLIFYISAIPGIIGILLLVILVREKKKQPIKSPVSLLRFSNFNYSFKLFILINCIFSIGNSSDAFLILRAQNLGFSVVLTILAYAAFNLTYAVISTPAGALSDRVGAKKVILIGFFIFSIVYVLFGLIHQAALLWVLFPAYGLYMALTEGVGKAYISKLVPEKNLGVAFGIYQTVIGICTFFSSIIAGMLCTYFGVGVPFIFGGIMAIISGCLFLFL